MPELAFFLEAAELLREAGACARADEETARRVPDEEDAVATAELRFAAGAGLRFAADAELRCAAGAEPRFAAADTERRFAAGAARLEDGAARLAEPVRRLAPVVARFADDLAWVMSILRQRPTGKARRRWVNLPST